VLTAFPVLLAILNHWTRPSSHCREELGSLKYGPAVAPLIALLKDRSLIVSSQRAELEEKICLALGRMNAVEAVPILKEIGNAGFFSMKKYSDKVKTAATKALIGLNCRKIGGIKVNSTGRKQPMGLQASYP
jgi:hypothetical protein